MSEDEETKKKKMTLIISYYNKDILELHLCIYLTKQPPLPRKFIFNKSNYNSFRQLSQYDAI